jgi:hypothetical protein
MRAALSLLAAAALPLAAPHADGAGSCRVGGACFTQRGRALRCTPRVA